MAKCKGNRGNLMQHWTLCECLINLKKQVRDLHFVSTHSMAPWSVVNEVDGEFKEVIRRLAKLGFPSNYECALKKLLLGKHDQYPSSAVFVGSVWDGSLSLSLAEMEEAKASEIQDWTKEEDQKRIAHKNVFQMDWRKAIISKDFFRKEAKCTYLEIDPMKYYSLKNSERQSTDEGSLYPEDIEHILSNSHQITSIIIQISTYSTQNGQGLEIQKNSLDEIFYRSGFNTSCDIRVGKQMASFVYSKGINLRLSHLTTSFNNWFEGIK